jgi:endonuclease-3
MPRESKADQRNRTVEINRRLSREYPDARCELNHENAYQLLVATILSAQCTDKRVNMVTPELFKKYPTPAEMAAAPVEEIGEAIRTTGFFNAKSKNLKGMSTQVVTGHGGTIPKTMEELIRLPGVGRKTANVILGNAYGVPGITVDTHMIRLSNLLKLAHGKDAVRVERTLMDLVPEEEWTMFSHRIIFHGRRVCIARRPQCGQCVLADLCPSALPA